MAIKEGYIRWSDEETGAIRWDTEEKEGIAVVIDEANGEVYDIGGGGDSDFSTAEVTITNLTESTMGVWVPYIDGENEEYVIKTLLPINTMASKDITVPIYKTGSIASLEEGSFTDLEGDVTDINNYNVLISGNCTFSISGGSD